MILVVSVTISLFTISTVSVADTVPTVGQYETLELVFSVPETASDPFDTYLLKLAVRDPQGNVRYVEGFFDGDGQGSQSGDIWKARLAPDATGTWDWWTVTADAYAASLQGLSGSFSVTSSGQRGGVVSQGQHFYFDNGEPVYLVGSFLDFTDGLESTHVYMSDEISDADRSAILSKQRDVHGVNKANIYLANIGDYGGLGVRPWLNGDTSTMDLAQWRLFDQYLDSWRREGILTEMWFFADDSNFGSLSESEHKRLIRYGMARTGGLSQSLYVLALEWQEGFAWDRINTLGAFLQDHNPWDRVVSVHNQSDWQFGSQTWPDFIATQRGNSSYPSQVNALAVSMRGSYDIPHMDEEFGVLYTEHDERQRGNLWANLAGGAAGSGTGADVAYLQQFVAESRVPWQRMAPNNGRITEGGQSRFVLAELGHHYLVYSQSGSFALSLDVSGLMARWYNPRTGQWVGDAFATWSGWNNYSAPYDLTEDWVLWVTDGSNLNSGATRPVVGSPLTQVPIGSVDLPTPVPGQTVTPGSGLIGYWRLDGNAMDSSGLGNDGSAVGPYYSADAKYGQSAHFDGLNDYVAIPRSAEMDADVVSIAAWIKPSAVGQSAASRIVSRRTSSGGSDVYALGLWNGSDRPFLRIISNGSKDLIANHAAPVGAWTHLVGVYDGDYMRLYVNGQLSAVAAQSGPISSSTLGVHLGDRESEASNRRYQGLMDEVMIWDLALSDDDIADLYASGSVTEPTALPTNTPVPPTATMTPIPATATHTPSVPTATYTPSAPTVTPETRPAEGDLIGYWELDGDANDSSAYGNNGIVSGATFQWDARDGQAAFFDGVNDYVAIPKSSEMDADVVTLAAWIKPSSVGQSAASRIISRRTTSGGTDVYALGLWNYSDRPFMRIRNATSVDLLANTAAPIGQWTHIVGTYDGETITMYVNGQVDAVKTHHGYIATSEQGIHLGDRENEAANRRYNGLMDEVMVYDRVLSASEVEALYTLGAVLQPTAAPATNTSVPPTATPTSTPVPPTAAPTNTPVPPTAAPTNTPVPPTAAPTNTPAPPTETPAVPTPTPTPGEITADEHVIGYWQLDGNVEDASVYENDGFLWGTTFSNDARDGQSAYFDGRDDYVSFLKSAEMDAEVVTLAVWVKPSAVGQSSGSRIISRRTTETGNEVYALGLWNDSDRPFLRIMNATTVDLIADTSAPVGQWTHVVGTYDGETAKLYVNGRLDVEEAHHGYIATSSRGINLGDRAAEGTNRRYHGLMDEVMVLDRVLNSAEVEALYTLGAVMVVPPTAMPTNTPVLPTATPTDTPVLPTATWTSTPPPTATPTSTPMPPTATPTSTLVAPTATRVPGEPGESLIGYWQLDGNVEDASAYGNDGYLWGTTFSYDAKDGQAAYFDGRDDYVSFLKSAEMDAEVVTLAVWVKPSAVGQSSGSRIISRRTTEGGSEVYALGLWNDSDTPFLRIKNATAVDLLSNTSAPVGVWTHLVGTYDGETMRLYVNGQLDAAKSHHGVIATSDRGINLGDRVAEGTNRRYNGLMDEVMIYDRVLSSDEVLALYAAGGDIVVGPLPTAAPPTPIPTSTPIPNLVGWWQMEGGALQDASGNGLDGSVVGATIDPDGYDGQALAFDGASDYAAVPDNSLLDADEQLTIAAWIKPAAVGQRSASRVLSRRTDAGGSDVYALGLWNLSERPFMRLTANETVDLVSTQLAPLGEWTHLAGTYDGAVARLYVNGALAVERDLSGTIRDSDRGLFFGEREEEGAGRRYEGSIDNVSVWHLALSHEEIQALYDGYSFSP